MSEKCPKCGAEGEKLHGYTGRSTYSCGTLSNMYRVSQGFETVLSESPQCLHNQLAAAKAEIERLRWALEKFRHTFAAGALHPQSVVGKELLAEIDKALTPAQPGEGE